MERPRAPGLEMTYDPLGTETEYEPSGPVRTEYVCPVATFTSVRGMPSRACRFTSTRPLTPPSVAPSRMRADNSPAARNTATMYLFLMRFLQFRVAQPHVP